MKMYGEVESKLHTFNGQFHAAAFLSLRKDLPI
jgi:hypothetical protein